MSADNSRNDSGRIGTPEVANNGGGATRLRLGDSLSWLTLRLSLRLRSLSLTDNVPDCIPECTKTFLSKYNEAVLGYFDVTVNFRFVATEVWCKIVVIDKGRSLTEV